MKNAWLAVSVAALLGACGQQQDAAPAADAPPVAVKADAAASITAEDIMAHDRVLSSDEFEGRLPGTHGEELTVAYLTQQFKDMGLAPGNPDGSYVQAVPLAGITGKPSGHFTVKGKRIDLDFPKNATAVTDHYEPLVEVKDSDLVFVGYGVVAPEYGWDDYKGVDVKGKTIVMLVNDPPVKKADGTLDEAMFNGKAMTYYGRWTYKYEIASQKGAAAAIVVHQTGPAGYPWEVVANSWTGEQFTIAAEDGNAGRVPVQAWVTLDKARELFKAAGQDFDALAEKAASADFKPVALNQATASYRIENGLRKVQSQNVIAKREGSDPERKNEYLIYTAHWDHLGKDLSIDGDGIYNGALDNASGVAGLLELAKAFSKQDPAPPRSVLFLAVTAEEQGLLGAKYYAEHPLYPLDHTLADINMDGLNPWGRTSDIVVVGKGQSTLEDILADIAQQQGRTVTPDPDAEKGYYYRSDHFEFAKQGVPALYADSGSQFRDQPADYGKQKRDAYTANDYHKPSDEIKDDWNFVGAVEDLRLLYAVGDRVARAEQWPQWKDGSEFKARREAMMGAGAE